MIREVRTGNKQVHRAEVSRSRGTGSALMAKVGEKHL